MSRFLQQAAELQRPRDIWHRLVRQIDARKLVQRPVAIYIRLIIVSAVLRARGVCYLGVKNSSPVLFENWAAERRCKISIVLFYD